MSLQNTLLTFTASAPATKNRVEILMDKLAGSDDFPVLSAALHNNLVRGADLTKALRKEYGKDVVTDNSVGEWRRRHLSDVNGL